MKLTGIYAPVPTPFDKAGGEILPDEMRNNLFKWSASTLDGYVVCGSNGELPFIGVDERALMTRVSRSVLDRAQSAQKIVTGASMASTADTVLCCKAVADAGADAVLLLPPHYFKGQGMRGVVAYFEAVAEQSPLPIILYNMPANTGVDMDTATITHLAGHPNIIGIKDTSGNLTKMGYLAASQNDHFFLFCGSGNYFLPALSIGAAGGTLAVANLYPNACRELVKLYEEGQMSQARELQYRLLTVSDAVTARFGIPALKTAMDRVGMYGGPCRAPLLPIDDTTRKTLFEIMERADLESFENWRL